MFRLSKVDGTRKNSIKNLLVKVFGFGPKDVTESTEAQPFGIDSVPIKGMVAVIARTAGQEDVVIGYIQKGRLADPGETRIFSVDSTGATKGYVWVKKD